MSNYVSLKEIISEKKVDLSPEEANLLMEDETCVDNLQHLYQVMGKKDENNAYIYHVGFADKTPKILLKEFDFKGYNIKIVSYVLNKHDLLESQKTGLIKMVGLLMCKNDEPISSISIEYKINLANISSDITELISTKENPKETSGNFVVLFRKKNDNKIINLHNFDKFPGNNNLIEKLHKFLWHKEILYMY